MLIKCFSHPASKKVRALKAVYFHLKCKRQQKVTFCAAVLVNSDKFNNQYEVIGI